MAAEINTQQPKVYGLLEPLLPVADRKTPNYRSKTVAENPSFLGDVDGSLIGDFVRMLDAFIGAYNDTEGKRKPRSSTPAPTPPAVIVAGPPAPVGRVLPVTPVSAAPVGRVLPVTPVSASPVVPIVRASSTPPAPPAPVGRVLPVTPVSASPVIPIVRASSKGSVPPIVPSSSTSSTSPTPAPAPAPVAKADLGSTFEGYYRSYLGDWDSKKLQAISGSNTFESQGNLKDIISEVYVNNGSKYDEKIKTFLGYRLAKDFVRAALKTNRAKKDIYTEFLAYMSKPGTILDELDSKIQCDIVGEMYKGIEFYHNIMNKESYVKELDDLIDNNYTKAVAKSKKTEVDTLVAKLEENLENYKLSNRSGNEYLKKEKLRTVSHPVYYSRTDLYCGRYLRNLRSRLKEAENFTKRPDKLQRYDIW